MSKTFTPKNLPELTLPLMNLKGNDYMKVAHRLLWFVNDVKSYTIDTHFVHIDAERATCQVTVSILDDKKTVLRRAVAHKSETKKDFNDFAEKAETGALGRALASLGYGTAQAIADLEEGERIVDAPLETPVTTTSTAVPATAAQTAVPTKPTGGSFRKPKAAGNVVPITSGAAAHKADDDWA